jgi:hypothetical protein
VASGSSAQKGYFVKICIAILILFSAFSTKAFEHTVLKGDSLWLLSQQYLGTGVNWKQIMYADGTKPHAHDLVIGRVVTVSEFGAQSIQAPQSANPATDQRTTQSSHIASRGTSLSFNTALYCCGAEVVTMDAQGIFIVIPQPHPFVTQSYAPAKQEMATFMNIKISKELFDAINTN